MIDPHYFATVRFRDTVVEVKAHWFVMMQRLNMPGRPPVSFIRCLVRVAIAVHCREPVLLVGPTAYKTTVVRTWASICGKDESAITMHLTPDTDTSELIGQVQPFTLVNALRQILKLADDARRRHEVLMRTSSVACSEVQNARRASTELVAAATAAAEAIT